MVGAGSQREGSGREVRAAEPGLEPALAFGYLSLDPGAAAAPEDGVTATVGRELARCAAGAGYRLGGIFSDCRGDSESGFYALLEALRAPDAAAVVVPDLDHLLQVTSLAGADARTASRHLQAEVIAISASSRF